MDVTGTTAEPPAGTRPRPPLTLSAGPLSLTAVADGDWPLDVELSGVPDVVAWTYQPAHLDEPTARERMRWVQARAADGLAQRYVLRDEHGAAVGACGVGALASGTPEVFHALLPSARGRGAATSAVRALAGWVRSAGFPEVALETIEGNTASERVASRAGFRRVGVHAGEQHGRPVVLTRWVLALGPGPRPG